MSDTKFIPRKFEAIIDEYGLDDYPGGVFRVQSIEKGKIYTERDPRFLTGNQTGIVIDDNSCWWRYGTTSFNERFKLVNRETKIDEIIS